jgi:hypothetical protein
LSLVDPGTGRLIPRTLLADTGAGPKNAIFDLLLDEDDCLLFSTDTGPITRLSGAYSGWFRIYRVSVCIEELNHSIDVNAVAVNQAPHGFDGIAAFRFLNSFMYGNFGDADRFGLEKP